MEYCKTQTFSIISECTNEEPDKGGGEKEFYELKEKWIWFH